MFQTTATNAVEIVGIHESFLTTRGGWKVQDGDDEYIHHFQALQDTFLGRQDASVSPFENISATECIHRYGTTFIRAGDVLVVMASSFSDNIEGAIDNSSLLYYGMNTTEMFFGERAVSSLLCKFTQAVIEAFYS